MRPVSALMPDVDRRQVLRVPAQPYVRVDRNDYSIDPRFVGQRVELRVSQEPRSRRMTRSSDPGFTTFSRRLAAPLAETAATER